MQLSLNLITYTNPIPNLYGFYVHYVDIGSVGIGTAEIATASPGVSS